MRFWSLKTVLSIFFQGRSCHLYIGRCAVFITCTLLLTPLPSYHASSRQHIRDITLGIGFSRNLSLPLHAAGYLLSHLRAHGGLLRSDCSFVVSLGPDYPPGLVGVNSWSARHLPGPYPVPFWASLLVHVGLFPLTVVQSVRVPTHRHLLTGVARLDSELTCFSSRFTD
jgi:hypothetical protein